MCIVPLRHRNKYGALQLELSSCRKMEGQDAMLAQLLGMGFQSEDVEEYQMAMATSSQPFSLQAATEWLVIDNNALKLCK